jgi:penicillin G amidase
VHLDRLFRYLNILIGIVLVAALGGVYWYFWRPLPQTSGDVPAPVSARVSVTRDSLGVPDITAQTEEDLFFAQGYTTAQDRLWQMDGLRRFAAGDLAEIVGSGAVESDRESRRLRMRRIAEDAYVTMPAKDRAQFAEYARGVNYFIETHRTSLPFEFAVLRYDPRPWSVVDSILISLYMYRSLTTTWPDKITKRNLLASGDADKVNFLFPTRGGSEVSPGGDAQPGSNAWAISGRLTASGKPLLSNDMHLEYSIPGVWFMVGLRMPGMHVAGVSLPGTPGVIVGHNDRIAWGVTNLHFDVQDLYSERIDERTGRYLFRGKVEQARAEREVIRVKGKDAIDQRYWVTRHGPIIADNLALRWTAGEHGNFEFPFIDVDRAHNFEEFTKAFSRLPGPGQNAVYADRDGNIGYHSSGKLPIRRNYKGDVPVDGSSGEFEWDGYIPFEKLPVSFNPANGLIVTSNQNPFPASYEFPVQGTFATPYRSNQIRSMIQAKKNIKPEDNLQIQKDVFSGFHLMLAKSLVAAAEKRQVNDGQVSEAIAALRSWDGQMDKDKGAPFIAELAFQHFRKSVADVASPGNGALYQTQMAPAPIARLLRERPEGWFHDYDEVLVRSLVEALEEGRRMQGSIMKKWFYGRYLKLAINHPVGHQLPLVHSYFDIGPVPASGGSTSVKQTTPRLGPSERFDADLGDWDKSLLNLTIGESGHILSSHYRDQWNSYYNGTSFPMRFDHAEVKSTLTFVPR